MNEGEFGRSRQRNKTATRLYAATMRPNGYLLIVAPTGFGQQAPCLLFKFFSGTQVIMTHLRLVLLATTALTAAQFASIPSHAQTAPVLMAQAGPPGSESKEAPPKQPPKAAPPARPAPPAAAPAGA